MASWYSWRGGEETKVADDNKAYREGQDRPIEQEEQSCFSSLDPFLRVDMVAESDDEAELYKVIMLLGVAVFIVTIIGMGSICSWFNYTGLAHIGPILFPYFGGIMLIWLYASITALTILLATVSMLVGLGGKCALSAFTVGVLYIALNVVILFYCIEIDPDVRAAWGKFASAVKCKPANSTSANPSASERV